MNPAERPDTSLCGVRLAIDWGKARIGVAASDRDAILAFPVETVHTADRPVQRLAEIVAEYEPVEVIMGLPVALNGTEQLAAQDVRDAGRQLAEAINPIPVRWVDERMTTRTAARALHEARPIGDGDGRGGFVSGPFNEHDDPKAEFWYKLRSAVAVILSLTVLVGGCVFVGVKVYDGYISYKSADDYLGDGEKDVLVRVPAGASVSEVGSILLDNDVVKSTKAYNKALRDSESDVTIQAGQYKLKTHMNAAKAVSILDNPDNIQRTRVTLPEGLTTEQQFGIMAKGTTMPVGSFQNAYKQTAKLGLPVWAKGRPEGFLFPDTYEVGSNPTPLEILQMQTNQFAKQVNTMNFIGQAQTIKRSPYDALIVASILEREAKKPKDMQMIAGIIYNRLQQGMKLESDATVLYANHVEGKLTTNDEQRAKDSPYNTYLYNGLPPTPIDNPGATSMEAAVTPIKSDYLYWVVTDPDKGTTAYSKTLAEHEKNVKKFQAWCQDHKGKC